MKIHNVTQGSDEWKALRKNHFCASDAAAMLGLSPYETRDELLQRLSGGEESEAHPWQQLIYGRGYRAEALARPMAETLIKEELYPVTMTREIEGLSLLASLDGRTEGGHQIWEHKLYSEELAQQILYNHIPVHHIIQMEQQLMVSGAEKVTFMCSDEDTNCAWGWYYPSLEWRARIIDGWKIFAADLLNYDLVRKPYGELYEKLNDVRDAIIEDATRKLVDYYNSIIKELSYRGCLSLLEDFKKDIYSAMKRKRAIRAMKNAADTVLISYMIDAKLGLKEKALQPDNT